MYFSKTIAVAIMAIAGANAAAAPPRPVRPSNPQINSQAISCGSSASPFCCSPNTTNEGAGGLVNDGSADGGYTCSKMGTGSSVQCNAIVVCCNNNANTGNAQQQCGANISNIQKPITFVF